MRYTTIEWVRLSIFQATDARDDLQIATCRFLQVFCNKFHQFNGGAKREYIVIEDCDDDYWLEGKKRGEKLIREQFSP